MSAKEIHPSTSGRTENTNLEPACQYLQLSKNPSTQIGELAKQVVEVAEAFAGVSGARLWRTADNKLAVWHQSGEVPPTHHRIGANVPLGCGGNEEILGILEVCGEEVPTVDGQASLAKFARIAAVALGHSEQQQAVQELSAILEATKLLNSTLDLPELLNIILGLSTRLCGADRGTVFLLDRKHDELWSIKGLGLGRYEIRLPIGRGIAGWVARHGEVVRTEDAPADPRFDPTVDRDLGYRTQELLAVAIRNKDDQIVGVLELLNKRTGPFSAADEKFLHHLSIYVATALENARLHRDMLAKQQMENDLVLARSVQRALLPEQPPKLDGLEIGIGYKPSLMVGGDYYDFMRLKPDSLLLVIADVEGKGMASALVMAGLRASLHSLATHVHSLEDVVKSVNGMMVLDTGGQKLLSMFAAIIDERRRVLHYINGGHVPPAVLRPDGTVLQLEEGGTLLGVLPDAHYARGRIQLGLGDIFVAYTDGITEATDVHGELYGVQRLVNLVHAQRAAPAKQIVETVLFEVDRFSAEGSNEDDRMMLILKVN